MPIPIFNGQPSEIAQKDDIYGQMHHHRYISGVIGTYLCINLGAVVHGVKYYLPSKSESLIGYLPTPLGNN